MRHHAFFLVELVEAHRARSRAKKLYYAMTTLRATGKTLIGLAAAAGLIAFLASNCLAMPRQEAEVLKSSERFALATFDAASNGVLFSLGIRREGTQDVFAVVGVPRGFEAKGVSKTSQIPPPSTGRQCVLAVNLMPCLAAAMPGCGVSGAFVTFQCQPAPPGSRAADKFSCSISYRVADTSGVWRCTKDYAIGTTTTTEAVVLPLRPAAIMPECRTVYCDESLRIGCFLMK